MLFKCFYLFFAFIFSRFCFSKALCKGERVKLVILYHSFLIRGLYFFACKIFIFINFSRQCSNIFAASLLTSHCNFLIFNLYISRFYILSKRFFLKHKGLSEVRVASITNKEYGFEYILYNDS